MGWGWFERTGHRARRTRSGVHQAYRRFCVARHRFGEAIILSSRPVFQSRTTTAQLFSAEWVPGFERAGRKCLHPRNADHPTDAADPLRRVESRKIHKNATCCTKTATSRPVAPSTRAPLSGWHSARLVRDWRPENRQGSGFTSASVQVLASSMAHLQILISEKMGVARGGKRPCRRVRVQLD
jgi:hypothetical protein